MSDRRLATLDQLGTVERGRSRHRPRNDPTLFGGDYPFFQTGDVKAAEFHLRNYTQTYSNIGLAQSRLWEAGTLCITIAANIAESAVLAIPACFPDSVVGFVPTGGIADVRYVKYLLDHTKLRMQAISRGTTQDNLSLDKLLSFEFPVPDLDEQRKIAAVLAAYDELIENNLRRIAILEEMAQAVYREWFVNFRFPGHEDVAMVDSRLGPIPEGWEVTDVKANVKRLAAGATYRESQVSSAGSIVVVDQSRDEILGYHDSEPAHLATPEQPIAIFGDHTCKLQLMIQPFSLGPNVVPFKSATERSVVYLFFAMKDQVNTTEYKRHWTTLMSKTIVWAPARLASEFERLIRPNMRLIDVLRTANRNLRTTRDLLLPKLVSGEINVSDLDIDTEWLST